MTAAVHASVGLTMCTKSNNLSVPCLNDTVTGTTTFLAPYSNGAYEFSSLGITFIQTWPPFAQSINLAFNNISEISTPIPTSLVSLNLSHNVLTKNWIQTPLTLMALDISYNQGGLPWMENISWGVYLPHLTQLTFRGNQVTNLSLNYDNFPMYPLNTLDLGDNPKILLTVDSDVYTRLNDASFVLTLDGPTVWTDAMNSCGGNDNVRPIQSFQKQYFPQGWQYDPSKWTLVYLCCQSCSIYYTLGHTRPVTPHYPTSIPVQPTNNPEVLSIRTITILGFMGVGFCILLTTLAFFVRKIVADWRERYELYPRGTICSSQCSVDGIPNEVPEPHDAPQPNGEAQPTPATDQTAYVQPPSTPRTTQRLSRGN
ncbi:hypothetical protein AeMF1_020264 [Aphanomyces euteiches]|nr:hypothetical protein AeMF1_020264 [Aphanomyces euteiches]KAH9190788.1 hypothetical protein AeNC1_007237 [Aphanomyces euteiches]